MLKQSPQKFSEIFQHTSKISSCLYSEFLMNKTYNPEQNNLRKGFTQAATEGVL